MIQFYFLSILCNGVAGFVLLLADKGADISIESSMKFSPASGIFRLICGILTGITGILKLLSPVPDPGGRTIYFLGDLIPAAAGICGGFILLFGYYREHASSSDTEGELDRIGDTFLNHRKIAGITLLAVAVLHFLFPGVLFL